jgi:hypothetical protein
MNGAEYAKYAADAGNPSFRKALISVHGMKTTDTRHHRDSYDCS